MSDDELTFEQPRSVFGTWLGIVFIFGFFALLVWAVMGAMPRSDDYEQKRATARSEKLKTASEEWNGALHGYGWVDKQKGVVRMPVQRAMELTMAELAQKKPAPAGPLPPEGDKVGAQVSAPAGVSPAPVAPAGPQPSDKPPATAITGKDSEAGGQPAAAANPPAAQPGTQPGPKNTPAAGPPPGTNLPQPSAGRPMATPVQSAPGTPLPVPGATP
ncbi:MAG: hypothetical protein H0X73_01145, partial [Chthoniobacterales bacterium]|nr:hypothetical protein [Chthoniobacterales bacterium]